jgi:SHS2 domain-containing protein
MTAADAPSDRSRIGHRILPHTADVIVEAWAPTRSECLEQVVRGVVETFADTEGVTSTREIPLEVDAAEDEDVVVALVGDVCYLLDADGLVVVDVALQEEDEDGAFDGVFFVAPVAAVDATGAAPKGVSRSELSFLHEGPSWHARVLVDV